jgi:phosphatidylserine/phosphatidylglycerophosphate/cardiolipin synthase-like enzyme
VCAHHQKIKDLHTALKPQTRNESAGGQQSTNFVVPIHVKPVARILDHSPLARRAGAVRGRSRAGYSLAPMENLEHVDVALIDREHEIDLAAYVLTDWLIMQGLTGAADHGVQIHTYLDGTQLAERELTKVFHDLAETPGVEPLSAGLKHKDLCV